MSYERVIASAAAGIMLAGALICGSGCEGDAKTAPVYNISNYGDGTILVTDGEGHTIDVSSVQDEPSIPEVSVNVSTNGPARRLVSLVNGDTLLVANGEVVGVF